MYRTVNDFIVDWNHSAGGTLRVLESLSDDKLGQAIVEGHSTLGWLGWHLATCPVFFLSLVGEKIESPGDPKVVPTKATEIVNAYKKSAEAVKQAIETNLTDEKMLETVESFAGPTPRGALLRGLIDHQTHHRGQMTVLLRQAGLPVPGVMGPTKEGN
ncbi:DinB family protein [Robertmurraya massiliosenegalensis]|uniref:DinB family protein n=1 Tax=Robertmurraya massiliosenegalensis TaxID=1287657 RepID=UPI0002E9D0A0|nr:DinB family protein [Robertmurraya massiliosenegalensis]